MSSAKLGGGGKSVHNLVAWNLGRDRPPSE